MVKSHQTIDAVLKLENVIISTKQSNCQKVNLDFF